MRPDRPLLVIGNYNYSSWSLRAWFYLSAVGFEFDVERLPLDTPEHAERIGDYSPNGRVPVLHVGDEVIWDSLAICTEVADRHAAARAWPPSTGARARARAMVAEMHSGFLSLRARMPMNCRAVGRRVPVTAELERDIDRVVRLWRECRTDHAGAGPWLFGELCIADAFYAPVVSRFQSYGVELDGAQAAYAATLLEHPCMVRWLQLAAAEREVIEHEEVGLLRS